MSNLKNKTYIVTGGGRGIGAEASKLLASKGANIILTCRTESEGLNIEKEIVANGYSARFISHDVTIENDWKKVIEDSLSFYNRIDGIINNAGSFSWNSMNDSSLKDFKDVIDVNLTGSFLGLKYGTEAIRKHGEGGSIVMISSVLGKVGVANTTAFCAAKGGVRLLAKAGACELGPEKIRVNSIHPGLTDTEVGKVFTSGLNDKKFVQSSIPLGRMASSEEIAKTILFLVSDESFFMTGAELTIDGGFTAG